MASMPHVAYHPVVRWKPCENGESADGDQAGSRRPAQSRDRTAPGSKGCILLVDDDTAVRETLAELLDDVGFHIIQAGDAVEAMMLLRQAATIDVLVTDLTMPGDDGIALIRQARAIRDDLPAILLTGYAEQVTTLTTVASGNYHVLRKPVEGERLIRQLELLVTRPNP
jgi:CheY-like chemotaxis protein